LLHKQIVVGCRLLLPCVSRYAFVSGVNQQ
jgi:hypothetical protein